MIPTTTNIKIILRPSTSCGGRFSCRLIMTAGIKSKSRTMRSRRRSARIDPKVLVAGRPASLRRR